MPQEQFEMVADTAVPEFRLFTNLRDFGLPCFQGLNDLRSGRQSSPDVLHSSHVGSRMVGWAQTGLLGKVTDEKLLLFPVFNPGLEGLKQLYLNEF